jgi:hypothetical protein
MDKLDSLITDSLVERLLHPERLAVMLSSLKARRAEKADSENRRIVLLQREVTEAEDRLKRLYRLVEDGVTDLDEVLKERLDRLKADRDRARVPSKPQSPGNGRRSASIQPRSKPSAVQCAKTLRQDRRRSGKPTSAR